MKTWGRLRIFSLRDLVLASALVSVLLTACSPQDNTDTAGQRAASETAASPPVAASAVVEDAGWSVPGGDTGKSFYSKLDQINRDNVAKLGLAWEFDLETARGQEATPVLVDGVLVVSSNLGRVYGIDPRTGKEQWRFVPTVNMQVNRTACCDQVNRGVAVKDGLVYVGALDGILYALDLHSGKVAWQANTIGDEDRGQTITGAPEVAGDVVVIGNGGAEFGVRGYVTAYDVKTGAQRWRFYTVPRDPKLGPQENPELEQAMATWSMDSRWELGLGGTVWDAIHYDPQFNALYIGVGNGGPYPSGKRAATKGDHLYLGSLVALDPATGRVKWHYQQTPSDSWDFTSTQPMILSELDIDGERVPVLMHSPKNGFLYVLDRRDGRLLRANPIVYQNWTDGVDLATGRPKIRASAEYMTAPSIVYPAVSGARNWHPASFSPQTGLYYASVQENGNLLFTTPGDKPPRAKSLSADAVAIFVADLLDVLPTLPPPIQDAVKNSPEYERVKAGKTGSFLRAIDPLTGETRWSVPSSSWQDRAGVLSTAGGLVFSGDATGHFSAYDATTGERLVNVATGTSIMAAPMTYQLDGVQYVAVTAGWGGGGWPYVARAAAAYQYENRGRLLVFKVDGGAVPMPTPLPPLEVAPEPPPQLEGVTDANIAKGQGLYMANCGMCHASQQRTISADLRRMQPTIHQAFDNILLQGWFQAMGMPRWDDLLSPEDVRDIHAYLIAEQAKVRAHELQLQKEGKPLDSAKSGGVSSL